MSQFEVPDRGRAWLIAFSACFINMILSGVGRAIGILYVVIIADYGVSRKTATLPFIIRNIVRCLSGPFVGVMGQRYGAQVVTFSGGVIASIGAALCFFAPNIACLTVFWGGIHGLGFAMGNTLFQVVVNQYFDKHRATASGIAQSGGCFGSLLFPFLLEEILDTYGLSGAFLILAGVIMHVLPSSLLLKAPPWVEDSERYAKQKYYYELSSGMRRETLYRDEIQNLNHFRHDETARKSSDEEECFKIKQNLQKIVVSPPLDDSAIAFKKTTDGSCPENVLSLQSKPKIEQKQTKLLSIMGSIMSLCTNPLYVLTCFSMAVYVVILSPIITCMVDYGMDKGMQESQGKYLITGMSFGDLVGRLCFGWITDKGLMSKPAFMTWTLMLQGVVIVLFPFSSAFYTYLTLLTLYGAISGSYVILFPVLVHKFVDEELQSVAIGCLGFVPGILSLGIPSLIGYFRDYIGSYDGLFYLTGALSISFGAMWFLEPQINKIGPSKD
ncbi:monocarboxylate transporter 12-like [Uloborus diversus]|uniref:monocarboxylate transporter 12-like n=1 Tax=Uloborus diversus TaxID=327109 RepID=UPI00240926D1|nr:monocarboxylate transporter 12-like [Uloborus diversus]